MTVFRLIRRPDQESGFLAEIVSGTLIHLIHIIIVFIEIQMYWHEKFQKGHMNTLLPRSDVHITTTVRTLSCSHKIAFWLLTFLFIF